MEGAVNYIPARTARDSYKHKSQIYCIGWQPMTDVLASGSDDGSLKVWTEGQDGIEVMSHRSAVTCLDWSVGSDLLATGCKGGEAAVLTLTTSEQMR